MKVLVETASLLEELLIVRLAIQYTFHRRVITQLEGAFAMGAFEARFVIANSISRQKLHRIHSLLTGLAFLLGPNERHSFSFKKQNATATLLLDLLSLGRQDIHWFKGPIQLWRVLANMYRQGGSEGKTEEEERMQRGVDGEVDGGGGGLVGLGSWKWRMITGN